MYLVHTVPLVNPNALSPHNLVPLPIIDERIDGWTPLQSDIDLVTSNMSRQARSIDLPIVNIEELVLQSDVQYDIRQILISLSEASAYIIGMGPQASRLIKLLKQKLASKQMGDCDMLEQLAALGFEDAQVVEALKINK